MQTKLQTQPRNHFASSKITKAGILAGISIVLMMVLEFPIPFMPPFLQVDFSGVPILIGAFSFGPVVGLFIALVKDLLHLTITSTGGVGELADFLITIALVLPASFIYQCKKTRFGAILGLSVGIITMAIVGAIANKYLLLPFFSNVMPIETIFALCAKANPLIHDINSYILFGAIPFNLVKGLILSLFTFGIYKRLSAILQG